LSEELFFRKLLMRLAQPLVGWTAALLIQAVAFALMHLPTNQLGIFFLTGIVFGLSYRMSGSLLIPVIAHALLNVLAVLRVI
jgi:membrane protease YdiL (CAAX protease family)